MRACAYELIIGGARGLAAELMAVTAASRFAETWIGCAGMPGGAGDAPRIRVSRIRVAVREGHQVAPAVSCAPPARCASPNLEIACWSADTRNFTYLLVLTEFVP